MPLAALIAAQDQTDMGDGLRATLPIAGRTLVELQAAIARRAGAETVVLLVERVPAALAQAVDRLVRQGLKVEIARSVAEAASRFAADDGIILIADGCIASQAAVDALVASAGPALLVLPDTQDHADFERIDAEARWAGVAVMDGATLAATAQMLGDWDLSSTLLRSLVQKGAARIGALDDGMAPRLVSGPAALGTLEQQMMRRAEHDQGDWVQRYLHPLVTAPLIGPLIARKIRAPHLSLGAVALAWIAAIFSIFGFFWAAFLLPVAAAAAAAEQRMTLIWSDDRRPALLFTAARHIAGACLLAMITRHVASDGGWGWWLVAATVPASLLAIRALNPVARAVKADPEPLWQASADALVWIAPFIAIVTGWRWMVMTLAFYAFLSFLLRFAAVRRGAIAEVGQGV